MILAAHAVRPMCPWCGRNVRGGVELQAAVADLRDTLVAARASCGEDGGSGSEALLHADEEVAAISAELTGMHLRCVTAHSADVL